MHTIQQCVYVRYSQQHMYSFLRVLFHFGNCRQTKAAEPKATRDLEMTSEIRPRNIPPSCAEDHVYASSDIPIQRNSRYTYGMTK